jgi:predicted acetyltransferase
MDLQFRAIGPDEFADFFKTAGLAFGFDPNEEQSGSFSSVLDPARTRCGFDGSLMVSTSAAFDLEMTVPGGSIPCGGTTIVTVAPTHRRRGVLTSMMRSHLDDVKEHDEPIAALWASDSAIYGRFGFGCSAISYRIKIARANVDFHRLAPEPGPVHLVDIGVAQDLLAPFYETVRRDVPGFLNRSDVWWEKRSLADPVPQRDGATARRIVVAEGRNGIEGFAQYSIDSKWEDGHGAGTVLARELLGTTPESWAGLWRYLLGHDLTAHIEAPNRPTWDPIFSLLQAERRAIATKRDSIWVRIMDIPAALGTRRYSAPLDLVIGIEDPLGDISGSYRIRGDADGAECQSSTATPMIEMDLEDLGACYMGRARFRELARAGRIKGDPGSLAIADFAFGWDPAPWCPETF